MQSQYVDYSDHAYDTLQIRWRRRAMHPTTELQGSDVPANMKGQ